MMADAHMTTKLDFRAKLNEAWSIDMRVFTDGESRVNVAHSPEIQRPEDIDFLTDSAETSPTVQRTAHITERTIGKTADKSLRYRQAKMDRLQLELQIVG